MQSITIDFRKPISIWFGVYEKRSYLASLRWKWVLFDVGLSFLVAFGPELAPLGAKVAL